MRKHLTDDDVLNGIKMARRAHKKIPALFEGSTDIRVYEKFLNLDEIDTIDCYGKTNVLNVFKKAKKEFKGIFVIVDADLSHILNNAPTEDGIIITDTHDLETLIINSECFDRIYEEFGLKRYSKNDILNKAFDITKKVGCAKLWSLKNRKYLRYREIKLKQFMDQNLGFDLKSYLDLVLKNSNYAYGLTVDNILPNILSLFQSKSYDPFQISFGHDLVEALSILFKEKYGNKRGEHINELILDGTLRLSYSYEEFKSTKMYKKLKVLEVIWGMKILKE
ncbi:conserved hypothetical protein [Methanococcus vannielii SB]|uniref:DUF4435 domain-containing protein n=1 Tax=Methanococcus vannielii (strain ATCC 35089 / DSM 1224 / JCM 13029 / OCM 148 / SB) TaxID=406327 RepID=A6UNE3_METVS|nr:DUF4435 domain-containing protein [Methanococcus vannielii]ABR54015.1 conserved hypothetical protein [Methanococcus vannielii SB]